MVSIKPYDVLMILIHIKPYDVLMILIHPCNILKIKPYIILMIRIHPFNNLMILIHPYDILFVCAVRNVVVSSLLCIRQQLVHSSAHTIYQESNAYSKNVIFFLFIVVLLNVTTGKLRFE